jgi:hypothetical protein
MVEEAEDRSGNPPKRLSAEEQDKWDNLIFKLGLTDAWLSDEFSHDRNNLKFTWTNKQEGRSQQMARLDRFYIGEWARNRGGSVEILAGYGTLSDHSPVLFQIRKRAQIKDEKCQFRFNCSFLKYLDLLVKLRDTYNSSSPRPEPGEVGWQRWMSGALEKVKLFCQEEGIRRAKKSKARNA